MKKKSGVIESHQIKKKKHTHMGSLGDSNVENGSLRVVEWVALIRFLFGMRHYQSTLDFAF